MKNIRRKLNWLDYSVLVPTIILIIIGIIAVYSAGSFTAIETFGNQNHFLIRQSIFAIIGLVVLAMFFLVNIKILKHKKVIPIVTIGTIILLVVVLLFGDEVNGARAWINLGFFNIQPAEIAKLAVIWYLAYYFSKKQNQIVGNFVNTVKNPMIMIIPILFLLIFQPDIGSALIILGIVFIMVISSGTSLKVSFSLVGVAILGMVSAFGLLYFFGDSLPFIQDYQLDRIHAFMDPFAYADSSGLQLINSYYALSRGGLFGVGLGNSVQKTGFLPEPQTDFIMAIVGEELGLVGVLSILAILVFLIIRIYLNGIRSYHSFNSLISIGVASMLLIQVVINIGGLIGLIPITGVTFPFISYGGSSLIINCMAIGFALNAQGSEMRNREKLARERSES